ncbi:MAG: tyrosine-type recombinase/integrase, partial [Bryobacteraceae bacterium]
QAAIDALPPNSGQWSVKGVLGLVVWVGKHRTSYRLVRRIHGRLVKRTLKAQSLAQAKREAMVVWRRLRPTEGQRIPTLGEALEAYREAKRLAPKTAAEYAYFIRQYLGDWLRRRLDDIAYDRAGFRQRIIDIEKQHGAGAARLTLAVYRAIHNWHRKGMLDLPESPTVVCEMPRLRPRDWALGEDELRRWWKQVGQVPRQRQVWWLVLLLTGARAGSVAALRWNDLDFDRRLICFRVVKGDRPYVVPLPGRLAEILEQWRRECLPTPSGWVFPSPRHDDRHIVQRPGKPIIQPHALRHTYRTTLAQLGCPPDSARLLLGHSLSGDVSRGYITAHLVVDSLRPWSEAVARRYAEILGWQ